MCDNDIYIYMWYDKPIYVDNEINRGRILPICSNKNSDLKKKLVHWGSHMSEYFPAVNRPLESN